MAAHTPCPDTVSWVNETFLFCRLLCDAILIQHDTHLLKVLVLASSLDEPESSINRT